MIKFSNLTEEAWLWFYQRLPVDLDKTTTGVVAYDGESSEILAVAVFQDWTHTSATCHFAMDELKALPDLAKEAFTYFFEDAGREFLLTRVRSSNKACIKLVENMLGFKEVFRLEDGYMWGDDLIVHKLTKSECRFLENGKRRTRRA